MDGCRKCGGVRGGCGEVGAFESLFTLHDTLQVSLGYQRKRTQKYTEITSREGDRNKIVAAVFNYMDEVCRKSHPVKRGIKITTTNQRPCWALRACQRLSTATDEERGDM